MPDPKNPNQKIDPVNPEVTCNANARPEIVEDVIHNEKPTKAKRIRKPYERKSPQEKRKITVRDKKIVEFATANMPKADIARAVGCSIPSVYKVLEKFRGTFSEVPYVNDYRQVRSVLLNATELKHLKSLNDEEAIAKAPLGQRAFAFEKVHNARRLDEGKSTQNIEKHVTYSDADPDSLPRK